MAQAVLDSAIDFCDRSLVVRTRTDPLDVLAGQSAYEVEAPSQQRPIVVTRAWLSGSLLQASRVDEQTDLPTLQAMPTQFTTEYVDGALSLVLYPVPDRDIPAGLVVEVATRPDRSATQIEPALFNDWAEGVIHGALYRLHMIPGQPFTAPEKAGTHGKLATVETTKARAEASHGRSRVSLSVTSRPFV